MFKFGMRRRIDKAMSVAELSDPQNLLEDNERLRSLVAKTRDELSRTLQRLNEEADLNKGKKYEEKG